MSNRRRSRHPASHAEPAGGSGLAELDQLQDVLFLVDYEVTDPVEAEIAMGLVIGIGGLERSKVGQERWHKYVLGRLQAMGTSQAVGLLRAIAELGEGRSRKAALAAFEAAAAKNAPPAWAERLAAPLVPVRCVSLDDQDGDTWALVCEFARAGDRHSIALAVEPAGCREAVDLLIGDAAEIAEVLGVVRQDAAGQGCVLTAIELDPAEFRWRAEAALDARDVHDAASGVLFDQDGAGRAGAAKPGKERQEEVHVLPGAEDWGNGEDSGAIGWPEDLLDEDGPKFHALAPVLRARLRALPEPGKPKPPHGNSGQFPGAMLDLYLGLSALTADRTGAYRGRQELPLPPRPRRRGGTAPILRLRVDLRGAKPPIWRRLEVPADIRLARLNDVLLTAFGWDGGHLHVFETGCGDFGSTGPGLGYRSDQRVTLEQVASPGRKITYTYDFGDDWRHVIAVEREVPRERGISYPRCTAGRRAGPPDDCGGIWGYEYLLEILADPNHDEHQGRLEWLGISDASQFDPAGFDLGQVNKVLAEN